MAFAAVAARQQPLVFGGSHSDPATFRQDEPWNFAGRIDLQAVAFAAVAARRRALSRRLAQPTQYDTPSYTTTFLYNNFPSNFYLALPPACADPEWRWETAFMLVDTRQS